MNSLNQWNRRWFGVWKEYGPAFTACPSAREFVQPALSSSYDKARLRQYLTTAPIIAVTSRMGFPCPFTGQLTGGSIAFRTDGEWLWLDDLPDYIEHFAVAIPPQWLHAIQERGYVPPASIREDVRESLDWPPIASDAVNVAHGRSHAPRPLPKMRDRDGGR